jgi:TonB family protein
MFDELPETNPSKETRKPRAIAAATLIQAALIAVLILLQMAVPQRFGNFQMISGTSAAPPPLLGQASNQQVNKPKPAQKVEPHPVPAQPEPPKPDETTPEGIATGHPEGISGGIAGGEVGGTGEAVRVGGNIRQPEIIKLVKPVYPPEAIKAHIEGQVILEATVTERGDVADIKVISGPPTLIPAAIKAVEEWKYEPTLINGRPVSVILTAKVSFSLQHSR